MCQKDEVRCIDYFRFAADQEFNCLCADHDVSLKSCFSETLTGVPSVDLNIQHLLIVLHVHVLQWLHLFQFSSLHTLFPYESLPHGSSSSTSPSRA